MIQIIRPPIPQILKDNQKKWTDELLTFIKPFGSYSNVPSKLIFQRDKLVNRYRQNEIKKALHKMTKGKCAFCESRVGIVGYGQIEHFLPKSIYPQYTFEWENLLLTCEICNHLKGNLDTRLEPILNPVKYNPADYFFYQDLLIRSKPDAPIFAKRTIEKCDLNRIEIASERAMMLLNFHQSERVLQAKIERFLELKQNNAQNSHAVEMLSSLKSLKIQADSTKTYVGFLRFFLKKSDIVEEAIQLVNTQLQLNPPFELNWN